MHDGRFADAIEYYDRALEAVAGDAGADGLRMQALGQKGSALVAEDRFEEARAAFAAAFELESDPDELLRQRQFVARILRRRAYELRPV